MEHSQGGVRCILLNLRQRVLRIDGLGLPTVFPVQPTHPHQPCLRRVLGLGRYKGLYSLYLKHSGETIIILHMPAPIRTCEKGESLVQWSAHRARPFVNQFLHHFMTVLSKTSWPPNALGKFPRWFILKTVLLISVLRTTPTGCPKISCAFIVLQLQKTQREDIRKHAFRTCSKFPFCIN